MAYVIGVDVGGTFTDAVLDDDAGHIVAAKAPSTPPDYSEGVVDVLEVLAEQLGESVEEMLSKTHHIAHGTTSSLNALVMGHVPPVGFLTTVGHRDSIYIMNVEGRYLGSSPDELQNVMSQSKSHGLIPKRLALEVVERVDRDGNVVVALDEESVRRAVHALVDQDVEAIAVSLLWSFRNPAHEQRIREIVHEIAPDLFVALSSEVSPRIREFARSATTVMSAQIAPGLRDYLGTLESKLSERGLTGPLLVMQSNGGAIAAAQAPVERDQHHRLGPHRRGRRRAVARPPARPPQHHLHRRRRHHVPRGPRSSRASRCVPAARSSTTTRSTCPPSRCTPSAPEAARSPGSTPAATSRSARGARSRCRALPATARVAPSRPTPTPTWCSGSSPSPDSWVAARHCPSTPPAKRSAPRSRSPSG